MSYRVPRAGEIFEQRYELLEILGSGGIGTVFKARQVDADRIVALKILHQGNAVDECFKARFLREAQALSRLSHEHIVTVYHLGLSNAGLPYLVMEYIDGKSLRKHIYDEGLSVLQAVDLSIQVCSALSHIHKNGIVHRDLKTDNIVLLGEKQDFAKIIDFGLARYVEDSEQKLTKTGTLLGSVEFMSPEQCRGQKCDHRTDIYALTICLYEMIAKQTPFIDDNAVGIMYKQVQQEAPPLEIPDSRSRRVLNEIIRKGLAKVPDARFSSADEMAKSLNVLRDLLQNCDVQFASPAVGFRPLLLSTLMILLVVLLGSALFLVIRPKEIVPVTKSGMESNYASAENLEKLIQRTDLAASYKVQILLQNIANLPPAKRLSLAHAACSLAASLPGTRRDKYLYRAQNVLALTLFSLNSRDPKTIEALKKIADLNPQDMERYGFKNDEVWTARGYLATCCAQQGKIAEARRLIEQIAENPISGDTEALKVALLLNEMELVKKLLDNQNSPGQIINSARICRLEGKEALCAQCLERASHCNMTQGTDLEYRIERCEYLFSTGKSNEARELALELLKDEHLHEFLRQAHKRRYAYELAVILDLLACPEKALELVVWPKGDDVQMQLLHAHLLIEQGRFTEARSLLRPDFKIRDPESGEEVFAMERLNKLESEKRSGKLIVLKLE